MKLVTVDGDKFRVIDNGIEELIVEQWINPTNVAWFDRSQGVYSSYERDGHWRVLKRPGRELLRARVLAAIRTDNALAENV